MESQPEAKRLLSCLQNLAAALRRVRSKGGSLTNPNNWVVETLVPSGPAVDGFTGTGQVNDLQSVNCARDGTVYVVQTTQIRRLDRTRN